MTEDAQTELEGLCLDCVRSCSRVGEQRIVPHFLLAAVARGDLMSEVTIRASERIDSGLLVQRLVSSSQWRGRVIPQSHFINK